MGDVFDQLRERQQAANVGQSVSGLCGSVEPDAVVIAAARAAHQALEGLTFEQARSAMYLVHNALELSAVVQRADPAPVEAAVTEVDRRDVRAAVLEAAQHGRYTAGTAEALLADLKTIRAAS